MDSLAERFAALDLSRLGEWTVLALVAAAAYLVVRVWIVTAIRRIARRTDTAWDDALVNAELFVRLAHLAPAMVVYYGVGFLSSLHDEVDRLVQRVAVAVMLVVGVLAFGAFLTAVNEIYGRNPENRHRPIKGYLQVVKILLYVLAAISIVSVLLDKSPWLFVSGVGAMSAVLLLIFKDTILSLVASVQLTSNDMVHVGDWIEMPRYGADGDVVDVALHTVKVQNWDKTITTVPTHALISDSFKNWRGMSQSGGRRIKRSLFVDLQTVRFLTEEEIQRLGRWALLRDYMAQKTREIERHNQEPGRDREVAAELRRLTNVGTLRAYIAAYLRAHPKIRDDMTLLVRQLQPGPTGLPIEIYCFTNDTNWAVYEGIQADLFDHILAIVSEFGLRVFQSPSGADLVSMREPAEVTPEDE